jgi:hypothetical protein
VGRLAHGGPPAIQVTAAAVGAGIGTLPLYLGGLATSYATDADWELLIFSLPAIV